VDHDKVVYPPFRKDFYIETEAIARMTKDEVKALRDKMDHIKVRV
jgi:ATP-dependent RNA helicase DDX46/PRP5